MSSSIISLENINIYQKHNLVLSDVNIKIELGEFVYLIGKTGSGKSSFLQTLYGALPLLEGEGEVSGFNLKDIKRKNIPLLRRKLGIVFQDFQLLTDRTVEKNLLFVLKATGWKDKSEMSKRISKVLDSVDLGTKGYKMPHELSGGEQQRIAIARALLNDPDIILADEPTGNLDPDTSEGIMKLLFSIRNNKKTILMATHNYSLMNRFPSKTLQCKNGKIVKYDDRSIPPTFGTL